MKSSGLSLRIQASAYHPPANTRTISGAPLRTHACISGSITPLISANISVEKNVHKTLYTAGFQRKGSQYERKAIVDSTLWDVETESQRIGAYKFFKGPRFDHGVNLSSSSIKNADPELLEKKVEKARKALSAYMNQIFGVEAEEGEEAVPLDETFMEIVRQAERSIRNSARAGEVRDEESRTTYGQTKGLFNMHVGYVPVMKKKDPGKVDKKGYGEMGRIYEQFFISEARFSRGIAISGSPWYSQKLWDDDADNDGASDSILGAPTVRSVADVGMAVAANFIAPGVGGALVSAALNMVDDAIFTALDVANGAASAGDAWGGFAKKGAISMGTTLTGGAFNGFGDSLGGFMETGLSDMSFFQDSLIASTALKATELTTNLTYTNAVHAVGWDGGLSLLPPRYNCLFRK
jgi:hypothetical protein